MFFLIARTAHTERPDGAIWREQPWRYGAVLEDLRCRLREPSELKDISLPLRFDSALKWEVDGDVNSLERRKAKKANVKADHSMNLSRGRMLGACASSILSFRRRDLVIGRRRLEERPTLRLMPRRSRWSNGASWNGSGRLFAM